MYLPRQIAKIVFPWTCSFLLLIPAFFGWIRFGYRPEMGQCNVLYNKVFLVLEALGTYLPLTVMMASYIALTNRFFKRKSLFRESEKFTRFVCYNFKIFFDFKLVGIRFPRISEEFSSRCQPRFWYSLRAACRGLLSPPCTAWFMPPTSPWHSSSTSSWSPSSASTSWSTRCCRAPSATRTAHFGGDWRASRSVRPKSPLPNIKPSSSLMWGPQGRRRKQQQVVDFWGKSSHTFLYFLELFPQCVSRVTLRIICDVSW